MGSRAGLDTGEDTKVVPMPENHVIFFGFPSHMLVTMLPELPRIELTSCHKERKKFRVRGASALNPVREGRHKKRNNNNNNNRNREGIQKETRHKTKRERNYERW